MLNYEICWVFNQFDELPNWNPNNRRGLGFDLCLERLTLHLLGHLLGKLVVCVAADHIDLLTFEILFPT